MDFSIPTPERKAGIGAKERADELMARAKQDHILVLLEKFGGSLRNIYAAPGGMPHFLPEIAVTDSPAWGERRPLYEYDDTELEKALLLTEATGRRPVFHNWFADARSIDLIDKFNGAQVAASAEAAVAVENKARLYAILEDAGIDAGQFMLETATAPSGSHLPDNSEAMGGFPFVLQGNSMGGDGTFIIHDEASYQIARLRVRGEVRISEYSPDFYSSIYAFNMKTPSGGIATYVDAPSFKATDIPSLGVTDVFGAGGDWGMDYGDLDIERTIGHVQAIGGVLYKKYGFTGCFTIEGFMQQKQFAFHEINARIGGGSEVAAVNQLLLDVPPFLSSNILQAIGVIPDYMPTTDEFHQLIVESCGDSDRLAPFYLKYKNNAGNVLRPAETNKGSGIYKLQQGRLEWSRPGQASQEACLNDDEVLVANAPGLGDKVAPEKYVCSMEGVHRGTPVFAGSHELSPRGKELAAGIRSLFI